MRLFAGSLAILSVGVANTANVEFAPGATVKLTVVAGGSKHAPVTSVSQINRFSGKVLLPVYRLAVIAPAAPALEAATANCAVSPKLTRRSVVVVSPTISGVASTLDDSEKVFTPALMAAGDVLSQSDTNWISVGSKVVSSVKASKKLRFESAGMSIRESGSPDNPLVAGSVVCLTPLRVWPVQLVGVGQTSSVLEGS